MVTLEQFVLTEFKGSRKACSEALGVWPSQITRWINNGDIVIDNKLYKMRLNMDKEDS